MSGEAVQLNDCGCCEGINAATPAPIDNRPGLTAIAYRVGTHARFKETLLARLSSTEFPALDGLSTRANDDFTIALLDGCATMLDVLTFYQERVANEAFLRTAIERRSVLELARLIGYQPRPGVAASTHLAFILEDAKATLGASPPPVKIEAGTRVQSVPGPDEAPRTFEMIETIEGRPAWNALRPQLTRRQSLAAGTRRLVLQGIATQLQVGDPIVLVDKERVNNANSTRWAFRIVEAVRAVPEKNLTEITWQDGLQAGLPSSQLADEFVTVYALRQRAALFGHNAPAWEIMPISVKQAYDPNVLPWKPTTWGSKWPGFGLPPDAVYLDAIYPKVVNGSWFVITKPSTQIHKASVVTAETRANFALSSKVTRITPDLAHANPDLRNTSVFAQSEALELARTPLSAPLFGSTIALDDLAPELQIEQAIAVSGKHSRIKIKDNATGLSLVSGSESVKLVPGDILKLIGAPTKIVSGEAVMLTPQQFADGLESTAPIALSLRLAANNGFDGLLGASSDTVSLMPAYADDPVVSEVALIASLPFAITSDLERTTLILAAALKHCYDRESLRINANVARATHGETVHEILGSGDARLRDQRFVLKQPPLTHVNAETPTGAESTLKVRVNDILWREAPTLFGCRPNDRVFISSLDDDARTTVQFGDGIEGARLPTGQENVRAFYRKGIGLGGNVRAGQLTTLLTRPLGVKEVMNPETAAGGDDRERLIDARRNAPRTVLTLDRVVSLQDYEDFTRGFAGIAKALATWITFESRRAVFLTVAGPDGAPVDARFDDLLGSLRRFGDPHVPVRIKSHRDIKFRVKASVKVDTEFLPPMVLSSVEQRLRDAFSFTRRAFGQPVTVDEVIAVIHGEAGVISVDIDALYRAEPGVIADWNARLIASLPGQGSDAEQMAGELLTLDPGHIELSTMQ